jgi:hypothetical protein
LAYAVSRAVNALERIEYPTTLTVVLDAADEGLVTASRLRGKRATAAPKTRLVVDFFIDFPLYPSITMDLVEIKGRG